VSDSVRLIGPAYAVLELTWACPAFCPGCPGEKRKHLPPMTAAQCETVLDRLAPAVEEVRICGGEAVNHPEFRAVVESLERRRMPFILFTAGLWEKPRQVLALLRKSPMLRGISFSIHGATEEVHDRFLSYRSFHEALSLIGQLEKASIPFQTSTVLGEFNRHQVKDIIRMVFERGSRFHLFRRYIGPVRPGISILRKDLAELLSYIVRVKAAGLPVEVDGCVPHCFFPGSFHCNAGMTHCAVDPAGNVKACSFAGETYGNLLETSLRRIWSGSRLRKWVSRVPVKCSDCAALSSCRGGCRALQDCFMIRHDPLMEKWGQLTTFQPGSASEQQKQVNDFQPEHVSVVSQVQHVDESRTAQAAEDYLRNKAGHEMSDEQAFIAEAPEDLRPFALFRMRKERSGYSLILSGEVVSVPESMKWLRNELKGKRTISDLEATHGREAALFIMWLHQKGFVKLERSL